MLTTVKLYLGITDTLQDPLLTQIIADAETLVNDSVSAETLPESLQWIVREMAISRFNRIGSEGLKSESEEGRSATYADNIFDAYVPYLDEYLQKSGGTSGRGKARFL